MRQPLAVLAASAVLLSGCGAASAPRTDTATGPTGSASGSGPAAPTPGTTTSTSAVPSAAAFPVDITRSGGIAGFSDRLVVTADGSATVSSKRSPQSSCRLTPDALRRLEQAVAALAATPSSPTTSSRVVDDLVTTVQAPATGSAVRLSDAPAASVAVIGELLADVTGAPASRTLCPPG